MSEADACSPSLPDDRAGMAREDLASTVEHLADAFLTVDAAWAVTYANRRAQALLGGRTGQGEALPGRSLWSVWPELSDAAHDTVLRRAARTGLGETLRAYDVTTARWWQVLVVPVAGSGGGLALVITAGRTVGAVVEPGRAVHGPEQARQVLAYTAALARAESLQDVTETVATAVLPAFGATGMLVTLTDSGRLTLAGHAGYPQRAVQMLRVLDVDSPAPIAEVLRTRTPLFLHSRATYLEAYPGLGELVAAAGKHAWAFLPLIVSGRAMGCLTVSFDEDQEFGPEIRSLLVSVSGLVALTLARARLRDSERTLAAELQSQLLPRALPQPPGITARAHYLPATDGMGVGGDWYDVLELPGGRIGMVIGDVQGHNMQAAAVMGQLRNALRAYAAEGHEPAAVLSRTNRLMSDLDPALFATCAYLTLDPMTGRTEMVLAGHPPPLLRDAGGTVRQLEGPVGPPLGVAPEEEYRPASGRLSRGDVVALFTDGLVEDARRRFDDGLAEASGRLAAAPGDDLDALAAQLVGEALGVQARSDDIAVLVVRHDGLPLGQQPQHARLSVDREDPRAARRAREFISRFVTDPALTELRETCVLLVSEVVTNALRHTDGAVTLELWRYPDRLRVEVSDETSRGVVAAGADLLDEAGRGVPLMDALSSRWGSAPDGDGKVVWFELDLGG